MVLSRGILSLVKKGCHVVDWVTYIVGMERFKGRSEDAYRKTDMSRSLRSGKS